jgi:hypothetical protein
MLRSVERHVLREMSQSPLVIVLLKGAGVHGQPKLGPARGCSVNPDEVPESIGEGSGSHGRIRGNRRGKTGDIRRPSVRDAQDQDRSNDPAGPDDG